MTFWSRFSGTRGAICHLCRLNYDTGPTRHSVRGDDRVITCYRHRRLLQLGSRNDLQVPLRLVRQQRDRARDAITALRLGGASVQRTAPGVCHSTTALCKGSVCIRWVHRVGWDGAGRRERRIEAMALQIVIVSCAPSWQAVFGVRRDTWRWLLCAPLSVKLWLKYVARLSAGCCVLTHLRQTSCVLSVS